MDLKKCQVSQKAEFAEKHASEKRSEGLGIITNRHATPFKARKRKKSEGLGHHHIFKARKRTTQAKSAPHRHESGHYRQKTGAKSSPQHARASGGNGAVVRDKRQFVCRSSADIGRITFYPTPLPYLLNKRECRLTYSNLDCHW